MKTFKSLLVFSVLFLALANLTLAQDTDKLRNFFSRIGPEGDPSILIDVVNEQPITPDGQVADLSESPQAFSNRAIFSENNQNVICSDVLVRSYNDYFVACNTGIYRSSGSQGTPVHVIPNVAGWNWYSLTESAGRIYAAGTYIDSGVTHGVVVTSSNSGATWQTILDTPNKIYSSIRFATPYAGTAIGSSFTTGIYEGAYCLSAPNKGGSWRPTSVTGTAGANFGNQLARYNTLLATAGSSFCKSTDNGQNWTCQSPAGGYENQISGVNFTSYQNGHIVGSSGPNRGWYRRSYDGGQTWGLPGSAGRALETDTPMNNIYFLPESSNIGFIGEGDFGQGLTNGKLLTTADGGVSWTTQFVGDQIVACDSAAIPFSNAVYVLCVGRLWRSTEANSKSSVWGSYFYY